MGYSGGSQREGILSKIVFEHIASGRQIEDKVTGLFRQAFTLPVSPVLDENLRRFFTHFYVI